MHSTITEIIPKQVKQHDTGSSNILIRYSHLQYSPMTVMCEVYIRRTKATQRQETLMTNTDTSSALLFTLANCKSQVINYFYK